MHLFVPCLKRKEGNYHPVGRPSRRGHPASEDKNQWLPPMVSAAELLMHVWCPGKLRITSLGFELL